MNKLIRGLYLVACWSLVLSGCAAPSPVPAVSPSPLPAVSPSPVPTITSSPTPPTDLWISTNDVQVFPAGNLYSGDRLSFRITVHNDSQATLFRVPIEVQAADRSFDGTVNSIGAGASNSTDLTWVWNTADVIGHVPITVTIDPSRTLEVGDNDRSNDVATLQIDLKPIDAEPPDQRNAQWATTNSKCCRLHYITGTAAERDIEAIKKIVDDALTFVSKQMQRTPPPRLDVYLVDRVLGQGGLANSVVIVSYLDRNYASGEFSQVLRHELTHVLDRSRLHGNQPLFLLEGFAVYTTGGHYRPEVVANRAASLLNTDQYIPLKKLIDNFYTSQHEAAYAEAAAFLQYLIDRFGAGKFDRFYTDLPHPLSESDSDAIDRRLRQTYNIGLTDIEHDWQTWLRQQPFTAADRTSMQDTIALYDAVRRYEQAADPSAYLLSFWIPDIQTAEARGITADYQRRPDEPQNIALETMLIAADRFLQSHDRDSFTQVLASANRVLDHHFEFDDPLAAQYLSIVDAALAEGYEPQSIVIKGSQAEVIATHGTAKLIQLAAQLDRDRWTLQLAN